MKTFAVLAFCAASVAAQYGSSSQIRIMDNSYSAPQQQSSSSYSSGGGYGSSSTTNTVPITSFNQDIRGSQSNNVQFETGNGISQTDNTQVTSDMVVQKQGNYAYTSPEGQQIRTSWSADQNGFRAQGAHLPEPVQMPADHAEAHRLANARATNSGGGSYGSSNSYQAPAQMSSSYNAPAPAIRVQSYEPQAPMRSSGY